MPAVLLLAQPFGYISFWVAVILVGFGAAAHQAWSANLFTTVSDMLPKRSVGSVVGSGGVLVTKVGGWLLDHYGALGRSRPATVMKMLVPVCSPGTGWRFRRTGAPCTCPTRTR